MITRADLAGRKWRRTAFLDYARGRHGHLYELEGEPRLQMLVEFSSRGPENRQTTYRVDKVSVDTIEDAIRLLNGEPLEPDPGPACPDLQELAERHGGVGLIPPEAWRAFDHAVATWRAGYAAELKGAR